MEYGTPLYIFVDILIKDTGMTGNASYMCEVVYSIPLVGGRSIISRKCGFFFCLK
jgi:hypothetical protein